MEPRQSPRNNSPLLKLYLKLVGESLKWEIESKDLPEFLSDRGYDVSEIATCETFQSRYPSPDFKGPLFRSEYIGVARVV